MPDKTYRVRRGDAWNGPSITLAKSAHDFSAGGGTVVRCHLRDTPDGTLYHEFTLAVSYPALGQALVQLVVAGSVTAGFPVGKLVGDVEVSRVSPAFGPFTPFSFELLVLSDVTH